MTSIEVPVPHNPYKIIYGRGELCRLGQHLRVAGLDGTALIVTNPTVGTLYARQAENSITEAGLRCFVQEVPDGEEYKNLSVVSQLYDACLSRGLDRSSTVIALGGGVIGDMAGFIAATYMRGAGFVQAPTSLLAQVDASIGGKVAIDHGQRKNVVGAFYQPRLVLTDPAVLATLPAAEFRSGMAEIIKAAIIASAELFEHLEHYGAEPLDDIIRQAILIKVNVVVQDPLEKGLRMVLNLGHTIGHGLEASSGYAISHGDAVSLGMIAATGIAGQLGWCEPMLEHRLRALLRRFSLPRGLNQVNIASVLAAMAADKKRHHGQWRFVLPRRIGEVEVTTQVPEEMIIEALQRLCTTEAGSEK